MPSVEEKPVTSLFTALLAGAVVVFGGIYVLFAYFSQPRLPQEVPVNLTVSPAPEEREYFVSGGDPKEASDVFYAAGKSIVFITSERGPGSGVVVAPEQVVTSRHGVEGSKALFVEYMGVSYPAYVRFSHPIYDLCSLVARGLPSPVANIREVSRPVLGEKVYAIGAPRGLILTQTSGEISHPELRPHYLGGLAGHAPPMLQASIRLDVGNSGGGLFDQSGNLIGIATAVLGHNTALFVPAQVIGDLPKYEASKQQPAEAPKAAEAPKPPGAPPSGNQAKPPVVTASATEGNLLQLSEMAGEMESIQRYVNNLESAISSQQMMMDQRAAAGDTRGKNSLVPGYNANVRERDRNVERYRQIATRYNALIKAMKP